MHQKYFSLQLFEILSAILINLQKQRKLYFIPSKPEKKNVSNRLKQVTKICSQQQS